MVVNSVIISSVALIISLASSMIGLILALITLRKRFDPIISIKSLHNLITEDKHYLIRNVGRGIAYNVKVTFEDPSLIIRYESEYIDILSPNEEKEISIVVKKIKNEYTIKKYDAEKVHDTIYFGIKFIMIDYENEYRRKRREYFWKVDNIFLKDNKKAFNETRKIFASLHGGNYDKF